MDIGVVKDVLAPSNAHEADRLFESLRAETLRLSSIVGTSKAPFSSRKVTMLLAMVLFRPATCRANGALAVFRLTPTWFTAVSTTKSSVLRPVRFWEIAALILADTNRFSDRSPSIRQADPADGARC